MSKPGGDGDNLFLPLKRRRGKMLGFAVRLGFKCDTGTGESFPSISLQSVEDLTIPVCSISSSVLSLETTADSPGLPARVIQNQVNFLV